MASSVICETCRQPSLTFAYYYGAVICSTCFDEVCNECLLRGGMHSEECPIEIEILALLKELDIELEEVLEHSVKCQCKDKDLFNYGCQCGGK